MVFNTGRLGTDNHSNCNGDIADEVSVRTVYGCGINSGLGKLLRLGSRNLQKLQIFLETTTRGTSQITGTSEPFTPPPLVTIFLRLSCMVLVAFAK